MKVASSDNNDRNGWRQQRLKISLSFFGMVVLRISISYAVRAYENMLIDTGINNKFRLKSLSICSTISIVRRCKIAYKMDSSVGTINLCVPFDFYMLAHEKQSL